MFKCKSKLWSNRGQVSRLWAMLWLSALMVGCGTTSAPPYQTILVVPEDELIQLCIPPAPASEALYRTLSLGSKAQVSNVYAGKLLETMDRCNQRIIGLIKWKQEQLKLHGSSTTPVE